MKTDTNTVPPIEDASVPDGALKFASPMQFMDHETADSMPNVFPVSFFARSAEPIHHEYWGRIVHDMDGMTSDSSVSIDFNHDTRWSIIGFCDQIDVSHDGLKLGGGLTSLKAGDEAWNIYHKGKMGVPWKSSIDFTPSDPSELQLQWVDESEVTEVNGTTFEGPGYVVRKWPLKGVAITSRGYDPDATTQFKQSESGNVPVTIFSLSEESPNMADNKAPETADDNDGNTTPVVTGITPEQLTQFSQAFGNDKGMEYLQSNLTFEAAQMQFSQHRIDSLTAERDKVVAERDGLQTQLTEANEKLTQFGASLGQGSPVDTGDNPDDGEKSQGAQAVDVIKKRRATRFGK